MSYKVTGRRFHFINSCVIRMDRRFYFIFEEKRFDKEYEKKREQKSG